MKSEWGESKKAIAQTHERPGEDRAPSPFLCVCMIGVIWFFLWVLVKKVFILFA